MIEKSGQPVVPVIISSGQVMVGCDQTKAGSSPEPAMRDESYIPAPLAELSFGKGGAVMVDKGEVNRVFDRIKPLFVEHGGDFQVQEITDDGIVKVKLIGECQLCIYKDKTRRAIESMLRNEVAGVTEVQVI